MEAILSSEMLVDSQRITRRYIPENGSLHNHRCENLKSQIEHSLLYKSLTDRFVVCIVKKEKGKDIPVTGHEGP
jgi:hypothetical protein